MINRRPVMFMMVSALVALRLLVGLAVPDVALHRLERNGSRGLAGVFSAQPAFAGDDDEPYAAYREALDVLKKEYYGDKIDAKKSKELTYEAIRGMLGSLNDPYTSFLDPDEWLTMRQLTCGDFDGIGAVLEPFGPDVRV